MAIEHLIAKALGISEEEIAEAALDPETAEIVKTAEGIIADVKSGKISREDLTDDQKEAIEKAREADESTRESGSLGHMDSEEITVEEAINGHEDRLDTMEKAIEEMPSKIVKALKDDKGDDDGEKDEKPDAKDLGEKLDKLAVDTAKAVTDIGEKIEKLGEGGSSQKTEAEEAEATRVSLRKQYEDAGLDPDLQGILN